VNQVIEYFIMADARLDQHAAHPLRFFGWVFFLSIPFYVWGVWGPIDGLLPFGLPISATMVIVPALVATGMTRYEHGPGAAVGLWRRIFDVGRVKSTWAAVPFLFMPAVSLVSYGLMRWLGLAPADSAVSLAAMPAQFLAFFAGAIFEEIGWTGYATEPLQERYGVFRAGLIIGAVWAAWHIVPWSHSHEAIWVGAYALGTLITRIVMGWVYAYGGRSLILAIAFHAMNNVGYFSFPNEGSHYNPALATPVMAVLTVLIAVPSIMSRRKRLAADGANSKGFCKRRPDPR
jgi:membrane protease YdiL (CAAX protease family)